MAFWRRIVWSLAIAAAALTSIAPQPVEARSASVDGQSYPGPSPTMSDWPQLMRGSYHEGQNKAESALSASTVARLRPDWDAPIAIGDAGAPISVGDAVYLGIVDDVVRYDTANGAVVWRRRIATPGTPGTGDIKTTPAYDHGIVVVTTSFNEQGSDTLVALNAATGAIIWSHRIAGVVLASPSTTGSVIYVGVSHGDNTERVMAFGLATGVLKWTWTTHSAQFSAVSSPTTDGKTVVVSVSGGRVWALDAATGLPRWSRVLDKYLTFTIDGFTVSILAGQVYAEDNNGGVYDLNATTGATVWQTDVVGLSVRPVLATPGAIVVLPDIDDGGKRAVALSPADGHVLWTHVVPGIVDPGVTSANGIVYLGWSDDSVPSSDIDVLDLSTGAQLARIDLPNPEGPGAEPIAIANGHLYVARFEDLLSLSPGPVQRVIR